MSKIEQKTLFPKAKETKRKTKKEGGFSDLIKVIEGSASRATVEALGVKITFGRITKAGREKFIEISRSKDSRINQAGSMDIPADLYQALRRRAIAVINSHAKAKKSTSQKKWQNDLF